MAVTAASASAPVSRRPILKLPRVPPELSEVLGLVEGLEMAVAPLDDAARCAVDRRVLQIYLHLCERRVLVMEAPLPLAEPQFQSRAALADLLRRAGMV